MSSRPVLPFFASFVIHSESLIKHDHYYSFCAFLTLWMTLQSGHERQTPIICKLIQTVVKHVLQKVYNGTCIYLELSLCGHQSLVHAVILSIGW